MGLLSDPEYGSVKWVRVLKRVNGPVCFLLYVVALAWFVLLGRSDFNNETYFSENALLPGLVTNEFNGEQAARQFFNEFLQELEDKYEDSEEMPVPWLVGKMSQLHLETYVHNFTLNYPLGLGQIYKGTNVYGILRAPRTSSLEALVVSAPYRALGSHQKGTAAGIALMLAFAQFARPQKYWAKDIIFLVTEHEQLGMQAWLEAYHGLKSDTDSFYTSLGSFWKPGTTGKKVEELFSGFGWSNEHHKCLDPGKLKGLSGSIQAAINLEIHDPKIKYIEVKIEGLNGQLPNLDLVNLVHKLCVKSGIHHSYKNSFSWIRTRNKMEEWMNSLKTMMGMVSAQVAGVPNGNHGLFHRFGIEAVTLEGRDANDPAGTPPRVHSLTPANFYRLGVALESILRSLNNLLERFHQSYFFYLLAATNRFISIGQYMPSLCLLCLAMLIRALALWVTIQPEDDKTQEIPTKIDKCSDNEESDEKTEMDGDGDCKGQRETTVRRRKKEKTEPEHHEPLKQSSKKRTANEKESKSEELSMSVVNIGANYLLVHLIGYGVMNAPHILTQLGARYFKQQSEVSVYYGFILISILLVFITPFLPRLFRKGPITREEMTLVNILVLVELSTTCLTVGMHNFPLGLLLAAVYTPLALLAGKVDGYGVKSAIGVFLKRALCLLLQPLCIFSMWMMLYGLWLFREESVGAGAGRGVDASMQAVMFAIVDSLPLCIFSMWMMLYGLWLFREESVGAGAGRGVDASMQAVMFAIVDSLPLCIFSMWMMLYGLWLFREESVGAGAGRGVDASMQAVMFAIVDSLIYGNWLFNVVTTVLLPTWIIFWQILTNRVPPASH